MSETGGETHTVELGCACTSSFAVTTSSLKAAQIAAQEMLDAHLPSCPGPGEDQRSRLDMIAIVAEQAPATDKTLADAKASADTILALATGNEQGDVDAERMALVKAALRRRTSTK